MEAHHKVKAYLKVEAYLDQAPIAAVRTAIDLAREMQHR
jgi:hypothetical protein